MLGLAKSFFNETKTLRILLESFCVHSPAHAFSYFSLAGSHWNMPSFTVESTLSSPCFRSDSSFSRQSAAFAHLNSLPPHDLMIWTDGSVPFPFGKGGSGVLANCSLYGTEATLSFFGRPSMFKFSAEACAILQAPRRSRQHQRVCHFVFCPG